MFRICQVLKSPSTDVDTGWAWVALFASFWIGVMTWGMQHSIGIIYSIWIVEFEASKTIVAWFTVLPMFLLYFLSPLFQIIQDQIQGYQGIGFVGSLFYSVSFLASSFVRNKYLLFLSYSFPMGIGLLLMTTPQTLVIPEYFKKHLSLATALATAGSFIFSMSAPPLMTVIMNAYTWRNMFQGFSLLSLLICGTVTLLWRRKVPIKLHHEVRSEQKPDLNEWIVMENENSKSEKDHESKAGQNGKDINNAENSKKNYNNNWRKSESKNVTIYINSKRKAPKYQSVFVSYMKLMSSYNFRIMLLGLMLNSIELVVSLTHIVEYAIELKVPRKHANMLLTFLSGGSIVGRIVFGKVFDLNCINKVFLFKLLLFISGVIAIAGSFGTNFIHLTVFAVSYGIASDACLAQTPVIIQLVVGCEMMSNGWTLVSFCQSFTILGGTVMVGWLADLSNNYKTMFYVTAASAILSSLTLMFMRQDKSEVETKENLKPQAFKNYNPYTSIEYN